MPQEGMFWGHLQEARWESDSRPIYLGEKELRGTEQATAAYKPSSGL